MDLCKEFIKIEIAGNTGEVSIQVIGLFIRGYEFQVMKWHIGAQVYHLHTPAFKQVIGIQQTQLMVLAFRQEKDHFFY